MLAAITVPILLASLTYADVNERLAPGVVPSNIQVDGLKTPLETAATTTVRKIQKSPKADDEDNLERLCKDPFHDFLCKPVTVRRRRITGKIRPGANIPPGIVPEASFVKETALLPEFNSRTSKSYLPPPTAKAPRRLQEPDFIPPDRIEIKRLPKNQEQETRITPVQVTKPNNSVRTVEVKEKSPARSGFEQRPQQRQNPTKKIISEKRLGKNLSIVDIVRPEIRMVKNIPNSKTLTSDKLSDKNVSIGDTIVTPDSSNISPRIENLPQNKVEDKSRGSSKHEEHSLERLCNDPFHSFLCKPTKQRKRINGRLRPGAKIPPNVLVGSSSIVREARVLAPDSKGSGGYNYPKPSNDAQASSAPSANYIPPQNSLTTLQAPTVGPTNGGNNGYDYPKPSPADDAPITTNPTTTAKSAAPTNPSMTTGPPISITTSESATGYDYMNPSNGDQNGYNYSKPDNGLTYSSTSPTMAIISTVPSLTTQPAVSITTNDKASSGYDYPSPTNIQEDMVPPSKQGYDYPKPENGLMLPSTQGPIEAGATNGSPTVIMADPTVATSPVVSITTTSTGYDYPRPTNGQEDIVPPPQGGYDYPKPSDDETAPSPESPSMAESMVPTSPSISITTSEKPADAQENGDNPEKPGYNYPKPENGLNPTQTTDNIENDASTIIQAAPTSADVSITTGESSTGYDNPKPSDAQGSNGSSDQKGYQYDKPSIGFTLPSEGTNGQTTLASSPTTIVASGPTAATSADVSITTGKTSTGYDYSKPGGNGVSQDEEGYNYPEPGATNEVPVTDSAATTPESNLPSITSTNVPQTTSKQPSVEYGPPGVQQQNYEPQASQESGYKYDKPAVPFNYPAPTAGTNTYTRPVNSFQYPKPTVGAPSQNDYVYQNPYKPPPIPSPAGASQQTGGYNYPKPANPLTLPSRGSAKALYDNYKYSAYDDFKPLRNFEII